MCAIAYFGVNLSDPNYVKTDVFSDASGFVTGLMVVYLRAPWPNP